MFSSFRVLRGVSTVLRKELPSHLLRFYDIKILELLLKFVEKRCQDVLTSLFTDMYLEEHVFVLD